MLDLLSSLRSDLPPLVTTLIRSKYKVTCQKLNLPIRHTFYACRNRPAAQRLHSAEGQSAARRAQRPIYCPCCCYCRCSLSLQTPKTPSKNACQPPNHLAP